MKATLRYALRPLELGETHFTEKWIITESSALIRSKCSNL